MAALPSFLRPKIVAAHTNLRVEVEGFNSSIMTFWSGGNEIWSEKSGKSRGILFPMKSGHHVMLLFILVGGLILSFREY